MKADARELAGRSGDFLTGPGGPSAPPRGEEQGECAPLEEGPLTDFQIGMIGGGLLGLAAGLVTAALIELGSRDAPGSE